MSDLPDVQPYLKSICDRYQQWWQFYTPTDAAGKQPKNKSQSPFDFGLMVQTVKKESRKPGEEEKVERFPVLEGVRKYAKNHVLLVGRPGSGKSTALARLLLDEATQQTSIPVLVELRYWQGSIVDLIFAAFAQHELPLTAQELEAVLSRLAQGTTPKETLLLFDGVNELPSEEARSQLSAFRRDHPKLPMIFTTRDLSLGGDLGIEKKLEMQPLTEVQMQAFVRSYIPEQAEQMLRQLNDRLREFGQTPLLLWMLCEVIQQTPDNRLPSNLAEVFQAFTAMYEISSVRKHEVALLKGDVRPLSDRRLWKKALKALAFLMMQGETPVDFRVVIDRNEAESELSRILLNEQFPVRDILDDLLKYHLLQNRSVDQIEFRHQLIQEYYAAEALLEQLSKLNDEQLKQECLNYLKWTEPTALMLALLQDEMQMMKVVELALKVDLMLGARLAGEVRQEYQSQTIELLAHPIFADGTQKPVWLKAELLGTSQSAKAVSYLLSILEISDYTGGYVAKALVKIGGQAAISALGRAVYDPRWQVAYNAVEALQEIGSEAIIPALADALCHKDDSVRCSAVDALSSIQSEAAVPILNNSLNDPCSGVRRRAVEGLGQIKSEIALPGLLLALKDQRSDVCVTTMRCIRERNVKQAIPILQNLLLQTSSQYVRAEVTETIHWLQQSTSKPSSRLSENKKAVFSETMLLKIVQDLEDENFSVYWDAQKALENAGDAAIPLLLESLEHQNFQVRSLAAEALGEIGDKQSISKLLNLLTDSVAEVRRKAAFALGRMGSKAASPELIKALSFWFPATRWKAAELLGKLASEDAIPALLKALRDKEDAVRQYAAKALGKIRSKVAVPALIASLHDDHPAVSWLAAEALGEIASSDAISALIQAWKDRTIPDFDLVQIIEKIRKDAIILALPHFMEMMPTETDNSILRAITSIQTYCKYYNYEIFQAYLEAQKADRQISPNSDRSLTTTNNFPNATEVKIFENVGRYYETPPPLKDPPS